MSVDCQVHEMEDPKRRIFTENDVHLWCRSKAYTGLIAFIEELNEAVVDTSIDIDSSAEQTGVEVGLLMFS